jgi:predicted transcriptional regulator
MTTILELASNIVSSHVSTTLMSTDELLQEIKKVYAALQAVEYSIAVEVVDVAKPAITVKDAFKKNEVVCMVCGKAKMKTLTRHLNMVHNMKPGEYRKQFDIPSKQPLTAKSYSESRRKMAVERGLGDVLAKARETKVANMQAKKAAPVKAVKAATPKDAKKPR